MAGTSHSGMFVQEAGGAAGTFAEHGNFSAVLPNTVLQNPPQGDSRGFTHYWRDNVGEPRWKTGARFGYEFAEDVGWPSLIQYEDPGSAPSDSDMDGGLLVMARGARTGALGAWQINPAQFITEWTFVALSDDAGQAIVDTGGPPAVIQSEYGSHRNLEIVVPSRKSGLTHYWSDWSASRGKLHRTTEFAQQIGAVSAVALMQSGYTDLSGDRNLEVLAVADRGPDGPNQLFHSWRRGTAEWSNPAPVRVTDAKGGSLPLTNIQGVPALIQRNNDSRNFELLVADPNQKLTHYWRDNSNSSMLWRFGSDLGSFGSYQYGQQGLIQSNYGDPGHLEVLRLNAPPFASGPPAETWDFYWLDWDGWKGPFSVVPDGGF